MLKIKNNTTKTIYWMLLILSLIIGFVFYGSLQNDFSLRFRVLFSGIPFLLFVTGIFGLLWPKIKPEGDEVYIVHSLLIGLFFIILFFIHVWILLPSICPDFGNCLGV
ncbi:hypothetical protein HNV10_15130 [Winogradskyella litoriviva]|uniref:Uncharacterized protein n=1 Tax=Winogradskyella litoriviva TaxID=1220182 RepID=A0ABX2E7U3_9FLAO|nr:hypothetical protein [Winogradskyella litoriviva]NRD24586.1 hypothetical protein [Winogradskyella litoriviva]